MKIKLSHSQQKFIFLLGITAIYTALIVKLDFLQGPQYVDEKHFWETSLRFSNSLLPSIDDLKNYNELNTPLPFIIFGALEYLFHKGIFAGRLLNLILCLIISFIIGWPSRDKGGRAILCLIGLLLCPYYLYYGVRLYTDAIAYFFVLMGLLSYVRNRYFLSCIAFILAIASRQYMIAFPAAIVTYEFIVAMIKVKNLRRINFAEQWRWLAPLVAVLSIFGWIYLFQGLAPQTAIDNWAPPVQKTIWSLKPGGAINFLAFIGFYIVIPEFILFQPRIRFQIFKQKWGKLTLIAAGLLLCFLIFPPLLIGKGLVLKLANLLPHKILTMVFLYSLSLLACIRFSQPNLMSLIILFNSLIGMKAIAWDKYVVTLLVVFWYLKSVGLEDKLNFLNDYTFKTPKPSFLNDDYL